MKAYRAKVAPPFRFPFRRGGRSVATGSLNRPTKAGGQTPSIKQFSQMKPGRPKRRIK